MDKVLSLGTLVLVLEEIELNQDGCFLQCNAVGNISILNNNKEYIGYIDFLSGEYELFNDLEEFDE